jgi:hypothetical protein
VKKVACALLWSTLALSGSALLVTGCGSSSGGTGTDGGPDSETDAKTGNDGGNDGGKDAVSDSPTEGSTDGGCQSFPEFVINLVKNDTKSTNQPVPLPTCDGGDPKTATEFSSLFK